MNVVGRWLWSERAQRVSHIVSALAAPAAGVWVDHIASLGWGIAAAVTVAIATEGSGWWAARGLQRRRAAAEWTAAFGQSAVSTNVPVGFDLLDPLREVVDFDVNRNDDLARLSTWCMGGEIGRVWRIQGAAGTGKTRFALHACKRLAREGWWSVWVNPDVGARAVALIASRGLPMVLVVDDADDVRMRTGEILSALAECGPQIPIRVLVLARSFDQWWMELQTAEIGREVSGQRTVLGALASSRAGQSAVADHAVRSFARELGMRRSPVVSVVGTDTRTPVMLIHAAALVGVRTAIETGVTRQEVDVRLAIGVLLESEELQNWAVIRAKSEHMPAMSVLLQCLVLAAVVGFRTKEDAFRVVQRLPGLGQASRHQLAAVGAWLKQLGYRNQLGFWIRPILPSMIGDELIIGSVAADSGLAEALAAAIVPDEGEGNLVEPVLRYLAIGATFLPEAPDALAAVVRADPSHLLLDAVRLVVTTTPGADRRLARIVAGMPFDVDGLDAIEAELTDHWRAGAYTAVEITRHRLQFATVPESKAPILTTLGNRLEMAGLHRQAYEVELQAVALWEQLAADRPDAYQPDYARALNCIGVSLGGLGLHDEALVTFRQAVALWERLVADHPDAYQPDHVRALTGIGGSLRNVGLDDEALATFRQAVALWEQLAADHPDVDQPDYARAMTGIGGSLRNVGLHDEALDTGRQAVALWEQLAADHPDAHQPDYARALNDIGGSLRNVGLHDEALDTARQAVALWEQLAADHPDAHQPDYASAVGNLGVGLRHVGLHDEALDTARQAVALWEQLAADHPDAHQPDYASAVGNLGVGLREVGLHDEALDTARQTAALWEQLAADHPDAHQPNYATAVGNLGLSLGDVGLNDEALDTARQAVALWEQLAADHPDAHQPNYARALMDLSVRLRDVGLDDEALGTGRQAVALWEQLAADHPDAHKNNYAAALNGLGISLRYLGLNDEALDTARQAVALWEQLAADHPDAYQPNYAAGLSNLSATLGDLRQPDDALATIRQAVALWGQLAAKHPDAHQPYYARALADFGVALDKVGLHDEALDTGRQAVALWERLAAEHPTVHQPDYARALNGLGISLGSLGRIREAMDVIDRALSAWRRAWKHRETAHSINYAMALQMSAEMLTKVGRQTEAATKITAALSLYRAIPRQVSPAVDANLRSAERLANELGIGDIASDPQPHR